VAPPHATDSNTIKLQSIHRGQKKVVVTGYVPTVANEARVGIVTYAALTSGIIVHHTYSVTAIAGFTRHVDAASSLC
jgi:hypothetical protein